ncbi:MAG: hypothetical protein C0624_12695 [Desulfuromonas sp.]|nr:MAG: hypothetical protein C0624_12695 [Desulfuromonas sp.]
MLLEIIWILILVLLAVSVGFLIPLLLQARRTAREAERFMVETQSELLPLLKDLRETSERAAKLSRQAEEDVARLEPFFKSLGEAGQSLHALTESFNADMFRYAGSALGFWLGMRSMKKSCSTPKQQAEEGE